MKTTAAFLLIAFSILNVVVLAISGFGGFEAMIRGGNGWTLLLCTDLLISLGLVCTWIWNDARTRGASPIPYVVLTCTLGSIGPLLYLVRRPEKK